RATTAIKAFFSWAETQGYIQANPTTKLRKPYKERSRDRTLSKEELRAVWEAAESLGNYGTVVRLILLLGLRKSETINPKTINESTCTFHDTKNGTDHTLPVTPYSRKLLQAVSYSNGWSKNFERLKKKSGVTDFTLHDCRRTAASYFPCDPWLTD